jgi:hypothetical protein
VRWQYDALCASLASGQMLEDIGPRRERRIAHNGTVTHETCVQDIRCFLPAMLALRLKFLSVGGTAVFTEHLLRNANQAAEG